MIACLSLLRFVLLAYFFCLPLSALNPEWKLSQYAHSAWRVQDGTFNASPWAIAQTTDGYIWIGTSSGLLRFDGVRFVPSATTDEQLASSSIQALLGASDGSLWIGSSNLAMVWRLKDGCLARIQLPPYNHMNNQSTINIVEKSDGSVWTTEMGVAGTRRWPLCRVDVKPVLCYGANEGIPFTDGAALNSDAKGNLWIGSAEGTKVVRWNLGAATTYHPPGNLRSNPSAPEILSIAVAPDGSAWVGIDQPGPGLGLQRLANNVWRSVRVQAWDSSALGIMKLYLDSHGALWIGTAGQGLYRLRDGEVEHFGADEGLTSNTVSNFLNDREGNLWAVTDKGVDCFKQLKIASYSQREGLSATEVDSVLATKDGTIWVGGNGTLDALRGRQIHSLKKTGGELPGTQVTSMLEDHRGRLWVGIDNTLSIYQEGRFWPVRGRNLQPVGFVTDLAEDVDGNIWATIRAETRRLLRIRDLRVEEELVPPQVPAARQVAADPHGGVWLGLLSGDLARYRNGKIEVFRFPHTAESYVDEIEVRPDGAVLGTTSFGLVGWRAGRQQVMTTRNGLPCNSIQTLITDSHGDLWLYTQCGLVQIGREELARWWARPETTLRMRLFDAADGAHPGSAIFNGSARGADGKLWFAMGADLQEIDPNHLPVNTTLPLRVYRRGHGGPPPLLP